MNVKMIIENLSNITTNLVNNKNLPWQEKINMLGYLIPHIFFPVLLILSVYRFRKQLRIDVYTPYQKEEKMIIPRIPPNFIDYILKIYVLAMFIINAGYIGLLYSYNEKQTSLYLNSAFFTYAYLVLIFLPYFPWYIITILNYFVIYGNNRQSKYTYTIAILLFFLILIGLRQEPFKRRRLYQLVFLLALGFFYAAASELFKLNYNN